ncbi:hypothetical protein T440DRAFT_103827 [Plenodomus tracheiphilus IPT5]|uniref:Lytic polysaccharide monooxygenase n=1 Tax=Plenodomus tracheiphilus IPT5 TaxID=1408161 RepID=A0A6A7BPU3_9PLEO|nr:hypothetical protein T440DRAFT_103827 [Plenodomus tracheiphilus IPT5]
MLSRSLFLAVAASSFSLVRSDPDAICYSYGVDFVDEGSYFINSQSTEEFTAVSYFRGCNDDVADALLVDPDNDEYLCSQMRTVPENSNQMSTCPIKKNQMTSGHWLLLVLGNNADEGQPFAWQRDLYLTVGTQITTTMTPTITVSILTTPTQTQTITTTSTDVITTGPFSTVIVPTGTAKKTKTVTPKAVTATSTKTMTKTQLSFTIQNIRTTKTVTATCTTPGHNAMPDKPCEYSPTLLHPAALVTPTSIPKMHRFMRKSDRLVDYEWARARVEAAKQRRAAGNIQRRAPDAPTITTTLDKPVSTTTTVVAAAITTTESVLVAVTTTSTIPAPTILSGILTHTVTLPTPTKTKLKFGYTTTTELITLGATFTKTTTITPSATLSACKKQGGHFWRFLG